MNRVLAFAAVLFFFELAIFLFIVPWSSLWETNVLFQWAPTIRPVMLHTGMRLGVSGLGVVNFLIGISEVRRHFGPHES